jgi:diadenosine tetraphosphate (Ap4A) HIT family hydrolase
VIDCALCREDGGLVVHRAAEWRVVRVDEADFPAFYRVIWNAHVAEFGELDRAARQRCMEAVAAVEGVLRDALAPAKINLASLGNVVPHLHWHVIARFGWDSRFPQPVWAAPLRSVEPPAAERLAVPLAALDARVARVLASADAH